MADSSKLRICEPFLIIAAFTYQTKHAAKPAVTEFSGVAESFDFGREPAVPLYEPGCFQIESVQVVADTKLREKLPTSTSKAAPGHWVLEEQMRLFGQPGPGGNYTAIPIHREEILDSRYGLESHLSRTNRKAPGNGTLPGTHIKLSCCIPTMEYEILGSLAAKPNRENPFLRRKETNIKSPFLLTKAYLNRISRDTIFSIGAEANLSKECGRFVASVNWMEIEVVDENAWGSTDQPDYSTTSFRLRTNSMALSDQIRSVEELRRLPGPSVTEYVAGLRRVPVTLHVIFNIIDEEARVWFDPLRQLERHILWLEGMLYKGTGNRALVDIILCKAKLLVNLREVMKIQLRIINQFLEQDPTKLTVGCWWSTQKEPKSIQELFPAYTEEMERFQGLFEGYKNDIDYMLSKTQHLIQLSFSIVSIEEAEKSRGYNQSLKRLSWITFIFLPMMFVASLFGMNVDLLTNNPSWLFYLAASAIAMTAVTLGWIVIRISGKKREERDLIVKIA